jgi:FtsH-binding integral membrane protein
MDFLRTAQTGTVAKAESYSEGLRQYLLKVYNYMTGGLALTGIVAFLTLKTPALLSLIYAIEPMTGAITGMTPFGWIIAFSPLIFSLVMSFGFNRLSPMAMQAIFWGFAVCMGLSLTSLLLAYTGASIARVFFITAAIFGGMSIYGYTTKRDLTSLGSFLFMGMLGMLVASLVNIWLQSPMMYFIMSFVGVALAIGLTAYDTQKIKQLYFQLGSQEEAQKMAIFGAFQLYFDFIYLFINLLRILGDRR